MESEARNIIEQKSKLEKELKSLGLFKNKEKKEIQKELATLTTEYEKLMDMQSRFMKIFNSSDPEIVNKLENLYQYGFSLLKMNRPTAAHYIFSNITDYKDSQYMRCKSVEMQMKLYDLNDLERIVTGTDQSIIVSTKNGVCCLGNGPFINTDFNTWTNIHRIDSDEKSVIGYKEDGTVIAVGLINDKYHFSLLENVDESLDLYGYTEKLSVPQWNPYLSFELNSDNSRAITNQQFFSLYNCKNLKSTIKQFFYKTQIFGFLYKDITDFSIESSDYRFLLGLKYDGKIDLLTYSESFKDASIRFQPISYKKLSEAYDFSLWDDVKTIMDGRTYDENDNSHYYFMGIRQNGSVIATGIHPFNRNDISNWTHIKQLFLTSSGGAVGVSETGKLYYTKNAFGEFTRILDEYKDFDFSEYKKLDIVFDLDIAYLLCITRDNQLIGGYAEKFEEKTNYHYISLENIVAFEAAYYYGWQNDDSIIAVKGDGSLCYAFKPLHSNIEGVEKIKLF